MHTSTGRAVDGLGHLYQSIAKILTTPIGSRIARRSFGSELFNLVDAPNNSASRLRLYAAVATALMRWEPRLKLTRVSLSNDGNAAGVQMIEIEGSTTVSNELVATSVRMTPGAIA